MVQARTAVAKYEAFLESERRIAAASEAEKRAAAAARYPALFDANPAVMDIVSIFFDRIWLDSSDHMSAKDRNVRDAAEARLRELKVTGAHSSTESAAVKHACIAAISANK